MRRPYEMIERAAMRILRAAAMTGFVWMLGGVPASGGSETPLLAAPDATFVDAGGGRTDLRDFRGRALVLNLWATWCAPCVRELPSLQRLHEALSMSGGVVAAVSVDRGDAAGVAAYLRELGLSRLPVYLDPTGGTMTAFGARGLPTTIFIDPEGREVGRVDGAADWDGPELRRRLRNYGFLPVGGRNR